MFTALHVLEVTSAYKLHQYIRLRELGQRVSSSAPPMQRQELIDVHSPCSARGRHDFSSCSYCSCGTTSLYLSYIMLLLSHSIKYEMVPFGRGHRSLHPKLRQPFRRYCGNVLSLSLSIHPSKTGTVCDQHIRRCR